jgi:hypothetical protein
MGTDESQLLACELYMGQLRKGPCLYVTFCIPGK